jgi:GT2 family glycosyltransferase
MISLLIINYRSARLALAAIESARAATSGELQIVVVDNSVDPNEAEALRAHADVVITPDRNLGYAGGINAGRRHCRGDVLVVSNPDVVFGAHAIDQLERAVSDPDVAVAGPALYWDNAYEWMLPPSELQTTAQKLDAALASRSKALWRMRDRRRIAKRVRFWTLHDATDVDAISGAVMAIRSDEFDRAGGFDERFALYFEENDFLRRVARADKRIVYVPAAKCRHMFNQSAGADSARAAAAYAQSELQYLDKWSGRFTARLIKRIERPMAVAQPSRVDGAIALSRPGLLIEASPLASFDTAAGHFPRATSVDIPAEVWEAYRSQVLYLRTVDPQSGEIVASYARYRT